MTESKGRKGIWETVYDLDDKIDRQDSRLRRLEWLIAGVLAVQGARLAIDYGAVQPSKAGAGVVVILGVARVIARIITGS